MAVSQFQSGQLNPTFLLTTPLACFVLRGKPAGVLLASTHAVDREYRVTRALLEAGLPVPEPLLLCEDTEVIGSMFYVMRYVPGGGFWDPRMPAVSAEDRAAIYDSANETLARLLTAPGGLFIANGLPRIADAQGWKKVRSVYDCFVSLDAVRVAGAHL
nr:phosphotransferase family protein [uncultured Sphingomonas sp.]